MHFGVSDGFVEFDADGASGVCGKPAGLGERRRSWSVLECNRPGKRSGTFLLKTALEGAKEWRLSGVPVRLADLEWLHDFDVDPRRTTYRWQGEPGDVLESERSEGQSGRSEARIVAGSKSYGSQESAALYGTRVFEERCGDADGLQFSIGF